MSSLLTKARLLADRLAAADDDESRRVAARLRASVVRPLEGVPSEDGGSAGEGTGDLGEAASRSAGDPADELWALARAATAALAAMAVLAAEPGRPELAEAAAALQDLAITMADETLAARYLAELRALQSGLRPRIQVAVDGPYLVTNARRVLDWLGQELPVRPQVALCRCGQSRLKPLCDGSHAAAGFTGAKDPDRVPDRRDTYPGQQVGVLDNRGTCQHAGYCTDRLPTVFRLREEPFVTASGGRMDEIIRAVRDCPSGALSYAIDGQEARDDVDYHGTRQPTIEVTKDGPYRVTGGIPLVDHDGAGVARNQGASREHYALCRCGQSQNKPFCSGMHWYADFHDPVPDPDRQPTIFEWAGGLPALTRMTRLFYEKYVPEDPLLAPLFATMSPDHPQRVAQWLAEVFCGPQGYSTTYGGYPRMLSQHLGKGLTEEQRARWVALLLRSARDAGLPNDAEFRSAFGSYIEWGSRLAVENSQAGAPAAGAHAHAPLGLEHGRGPARIQGFRPRPARGGPDAAGAAGGRRAGPVRARTSRRCSGARTGSRCSAPSTCGPTTTWPRTPARSSGRLRDGSMPCDGAWPPPQVEAFQRWTETGKLR